MIIHHKVQGLYLTPSTLPIYSYQQITYTGSFHRNHDYIRLYNLKQLSKVKLDLFTERFQYAPNDFNSPLFYERRKHFVDNRLLQIKTADSQVRQRISIIYIRIYIYIYVYIFIIVNYAILFACTMNCCIYNSIILPIVC